MITKGDSIKRTLDVFYTEKSLEYCQGIGEDSPIINLDKWIELGQDVIRDLGKNNILIKKWNESVKNGKIVSSVRNFILTIFNLNK